MDRVSKLLGQSKLAAECVSTPELVVAAWAGAVGKRIATRTRATGLYAGKLVVEVEDAIWQGQLKTLEPHILRRMREAAGENAVRRIEFRVGIPRRGPLREQHVVRGADEADGIEDPYLSRIYRMKRKRESA